MTRRHLLRLLLPSLVVACLAVSCSSDGSSSNGDGTVPGGGATTSTTEASAAKVSSEVLAEFAPPESPGYTMYLYRVVVPPGVQIPSHHHPGQQMARIQEGTLTYTVEQGTLQIGRNGADEPTETVTGPATIELQTGDSVYEPESMVHHAVNEGDIDVVIIISSLITTGQPLSIPTSP